LGALAGGSGLAIIIPPSILMIIYGSLCEISVGRLFYAGVFPGIILAAIFAAYIITRAIINPALAPPPETPHSSFPQKLVATVYLLPFMALIALVLGSIWGGLASPSEAAALGAFGSIILLVYYRRFSWNTIKRILFATVRTNCMVMFILIGGTLFTQVMVQIGLASELAHWVTSLQVSRWVIFSFMQFAILVTGCFLDPASLLFILMPIFLPTVKALGFDLYWFGILVMINCSVATITPPVGIVLYVLKAVSPRNVDLRDIVRGTGIYWVLYFIGMLPVIFFPRLVHWLPRLIIGS
jgi:tripartite ATP-independent transporter DctM subunit